MFCFFFFQAEDGIRDRTVTGVQTCALPIFGIDTIMLTGDNERTAREIGHSIGINKIFADVLPSEKVDIVEQIQNEGNSKKRSEERRVGKECRYRWGRED